MDGVVESKHTGSKPGLRDVAIHEPVSVQESQLADRVEDEARPMAAASPTQSMPPPTPPTKPSDFPHRESITMSEASRMNSTHGAFSPSQSSVSLTNVPPSSSSSLHRRSLTISRAKGSHVSAVLITTALESIAASREAKKLGPIRESVARALELIRTGKGGDSPREIFEPLRLACETRNEKLMVTSLDCISKLISYSFFVDDESMHLQPAGLPSPPPSPAHGRRSSTHSQPDAPPPSLVDLVVHTVTACHSENTPDAVSLQVVKALLSLVLSSTTLVHQSSLLKAVRTVYNVFLTSNDPVNQTVAQGGLTQMIHHVFARCKVIPPPPEPFSPTIVTSSSLASEKGSQDLASDASANVKSGLGNEANVADNESTEEITVEIPQTPL
jgi:brefeldin A-inhibited guanine nucleotide-exchange protein